MIRTKKKKKAAQDVDEEANDILDRMEDDMGQSLSEHNVISPDVNCRG